MSIQIIQLSDIHFKEKANSLLEKSDQIFDAIKNELQENPILMISGDSAFSGANSEFEIAKTFFKNLKKELDTYSNKQLRINVIPGNHDCQDLIIKDPIRKLLIDSIQQPDGIIEIEVVKEISKNLSNYFTYEEELNEDLEIIHNSDLVKVYKISFDSKIILLYCYNTAFQSIKDEIPGKMVFPIHLIDESIYKLSADLKISCLHHPFHWLNPEHNRNFRNLIERTSDFYFTGHEHIESKSLISDLEGDFVYHIEGSVLQDSYNKSNSGFNIINVDLKQNIFQIKIFKWNGEKYKEVNDNIHWNPLKRGILKINNPYELSDSFKIKLNDIGANFSHPNVSQVNLQDIYVFPNLELLNQVEDSDDEVGVLTINAKDLFNDLKKQIRLIISGTENIGKTSLLKTCFRTLYAQKYIPIFIEGFQIKDTNLDDFNKLLQKQFHEQYTSSEVEDFNQLNKSKLIVIIDDFNRTKINLRYKGRLLQNLISTYPNIIITGNELMSLEDIVIDENSDEDLYSTFKLYQIKEFGHQLRNELINKWNVLGNEQSISEETRIKKLHNAENIINTVIGINFVPSFPFFILTILQSIEIGNPTDLSASTFGHYYQFLIQKSFTNILSSQREITEYENYLSELSYYLFANTLREFDVHEFDKFDKKYRENYTITHSLERITKNLIKAKILDNIGGVLDYKYSYIHYYFVSNYIANHISDKEIKDLIITLTDKLFKSENSNILLFLTHHTKDNFLLTELLKKAKSIFESLAPCKLEDDIKTINNLGDKIPELVFESRSVDDYREEENKFKDDISSKSDERLIESELSANDIDIVSELNTAFKALEIVGQILKNNYGKIDNRTIEMLLEESILLGLRSLNVFFTIIEENSEFVINQVNSIITEIEKARGKKIDNPKKIESLSKSAVFGLCNQISYCFIKKISDSIGTEYLNEILEKVYAKQNYYSVKLIKLAIKLDHYRTFPDSDIKKLKSEFDGSHLPTQIMKRLVVNHLYLYPTDHKQKSRILNFLNIPVKSQLRIDQTSKQKKK